MELPPQVFEYVRSLFGSVDDAVSKKISLTPNTPEESLDIAFIESLSGYAAPKVVCPGWAVRISSHFIGSIRHFRRYEVADIGVVVVFKRGTKVLKRKLVLLQSKRLYPNNFRVTELDEFDYELGLAMVTREEPHETPIFSSILFEFDSTSAYGALRTNSRQCQTIQDHFEHTKIPVHYMFYNPLVLPWEFSYPVGSHPELPSRSFGTRVIEMDTVHGALADGSGALKISDIGKAEEEFVFGHSLADFFVDVLKCNQGYTYDGEKDIGLRNLFRRKSGPIFSVIEVVVEQSAD
ncbi:hypothetical protein [Algirhabdus cladophorae]|uniref:hypothetical protein n=1 Tax=Algirhabdus cladophorae TaxID=3377108 RepID=UPI003B84AE0E